MKQKTKDIINIILIYIVILFVLLIVFYLSADIGNQYSGVIDYSNYNKTMR